MQAKIVPDYLMPFTEDGRKVEVLISILALTNRTTAFVPHEMYITFLTGCTVREMKKHENMEEKKELLFDIIKRLSIDQYNQEWAKYSSYNEEKKLEYIQDAEERGIPIHVDMINEDESIFFKLKRAEEELDYVKPDVLYQYKWGHVYRIDRPHYIGKMYFIPLRQTDRKNYSCRATGAVNQKGLPERSFKNKRYESAYSDTAVRFGEYEMPCFLIGMTPEEVTCLEAYYRTSPEASSALVNAQFLEQRMMEYLPFYKSVTGVIFKVLMKHLGFDMWFGDEYDTIKPHDNEVVREHILDGEVINCTNADFEYYLLRSKIRHAILRRKGPQTKARLDRLVKEELEKQHIPGIKLPWENCEEKDASMEGSATFIGCTIGREISDDEYEVINETIM